MFGSAGIALVALGAVILVWHMYDMYGCTDNGCIISNTYMFATVGVMNAFFMVTGLMAIFAAYRQKHGQVRHMSRPVGVEILGILTIIYGIYIAYESIRRIILNAMLDAMIQVSSSPAYVMILWSMLVASAVIIVTGYGLCKGRAWARRLLVAFVIILLAYIIISNMALFVVPDLEPTFTYPRPTLPSYMTPVEPQEPTITSFDIFTAFMYLAAKMSLWYVPLPSLLYLDAIPIAIYGLALWYLHRPHVRKRFS